MNLTLVNRHAVPDQPWRNGGGTTRELLAWPAGVAWALRVSVATIASDGPFSAFPGVRRCFTVLEGAGVRLALPGGERLQTSAGEPLVFDGAAAPGCTLLDGPTVDLNLMAQQADGQPVMRRARPGSSAAGGLRWRGLYTEDALVLDADGRRIDLAPGTLAWSDAAGVHWSLPAGPAAARAWWLELAPPEAA